MAIPGVWQDLSNSTKLGKLVKEYNNNFSSECGIDKIMTLAGLISGSITFTSIFLWFINFHDNSKLSADQVVVYLLLFFFLSCVVSYRVSNWWTSRRLPRWAKEMMDEIMYAHLLITPQTALRLLDSVALIRATIKLTPEQARVLNDVHTMGTEEMNRQQLMYIASEMIHKLEKMKSMALKFADLARDQTCMEKFLVSVDSTIQVVNAYKN